MGRRLLEALAQRHHVLAIARNPLDPVAMLGAKSTVATCNIRKESLVDALHAFVPDVVISTTCCYETDPQYLDKTVDANYVFPSEVLRIVNHAAQGRRVRFLSIGSSLPRDLNLYSLTKRQFNELGNFFSQLGRIEFCNIGLESFYGEDEPRNRFVSRALERLRSGGSLDLTEGLQRRDYVNIDDIVSVLGFLVATAEALPAEIPLGSGTAPSIREIVEFLAGELKSASPLNFGAVTARKNEPSTVADLSVLRGLGYDKPFLAWKDGMKNMIRSMR